MSNKLQVFRDENSCWNKADNDEPVFVLRAKDPIAPMVVRIWALLSALLHAHEDKKIAGAHDVARDMTVWRARMYGNPRIDWGD